MISFLVIILILVLGCFVYGNHIEKKFGKDPNREMPARKE